MGWFIKPFFGYNNNEDYLYPGEGRENYREPKQVERFDHVSANGQKVSYYVGGRDFIEVTIPWQTDAQLVEWQTMWDTISQGDEFSYHTDDSIPICGDGTISGDGTICGDPASGDTYTMTTVTLEDTEFNPEPEEIDGYWRMTIRMREAV